MGLYGSPEFLDNTKKETKCRHCGTSFDSNFCPNCGASANVIRAGADVSKRKARWQIPYFISMVPLYHSWASYGSGDSRDILRSNPFCRGCSRSMSVLCRCLADLPEEVCVAFGNDAHEPRHLSQFLCHGTAISLAGHKNHPARPAPRHLISAGVPGCPRWMCRIRVPRMSACPGDGGCGNR